MPKYDERAEIPFNVRLKRLRRQTARRVVPLVEALVPHKDAQFITQIQRLGRDGIVTRTKRVRAHVLHEQKLPTHRRAAVCPAEKTHVVVQIHALELHTPPVEVEAVLLPDIGACADADRKRDLAYAKAHSPPGVRRKSTN